MNLYNFNRYIYNDNILNNLDKMEISSEFNPYLNNEFLDNDKKGIVRIATIPSIADYLLPLILKELNILGYHFEVFILENSKKIEEEFYIGEYDLCFVQDILNSINLFDEKYYGVVHKSSPLSCKSFVTINEFILEPLILTTDICDIRMSLNKLLFENKLNLGLFMEISQNDPLFEFISNGFGSSIVPKIMLNSMPKKLTALEIIDCGFYRNVGLLSNSHPLTNLIVSLVNRLFN